MSYIKTNIITNRDNIVKNGRNSASRNEVRSEGSRIHGVFYGGQNKYRFWPIGS